MGKFEYWEEWEIYRIVNLRLARHDKNFKDGHMHSILFRRGNRFVVSVHARRPVAGYPDETEQYTYHVVMELAWQDGKRGVRTLHSHEAGYNVYDGPFRCSECLTEFGADELRQQRGW